MIKTPNNQPIVSGIGRREVIEEVGGGRGCGRGNRPIVRGGNWKDKIKIKINTSWPLAASD